VELEAPRRRNSIISHGFKKKLSIITNAEKHRNKRFVFNIDINSRQSILDGCEDFSKPTISSL